MNLSTYSSYLLSELPEEIETIDSRIMTTKNLIYKDFYIASGTRGKVSLHNNQKLKNVIMAKKGKLVKLVKFQGTDCVVLDQGNGDFLVEPLNSE